MLFVIKRFMSDFDRLAEFLRSKQYQVAVTNQVAHGTRFEYRRAVVTGNDVYAIFCEPNFGDEHQFLEGRIAGDNVDCYNKISQCPFVMKLPTNEHECEIILNSLRYLGTKDGLEWSESLGFIYDQRLPRDI